MLSLALWLVMVSMSWFILHYCCSISPSFLYSQDGYFTATWKDAVLQVSIQLQTQDGSAFECKHIKLCLTPDSGSQEKENKRKILASSRLDLSNMRLQCNGDEGQTCC